MFHDAVVRTFSRGKGKVSIGEAEAYVRRAMFTARIDSTRTDSAWRRVFHLLKDETQESSQAHTVDFRTDLQEALRHLSPRERACTVLRFYDDLTAAGIGRELGTSEGGVRRHLSDAAVKLRGQLGAFEDDPTQGVSYAAVQETHPGKKAEQEVAAKKQTEQESAKKKEPDKKSADSRMDGDSKNKDEHDGKTKQYSCLAHGWVYQD